MSTTNDALTRQINEEIESLSVLTDEEKEAKTTYLKELHDMRIRELQVENEKAAKEADLVEAKKARISKTVTDSIMGVGTLGFLGYWLRTGFKFEAEGSICSSMMRQIIGMSSKLFKFWR